MVLPKDVTRLDAPGTHHMKRSFVIAGMAVLTACVLAMPEAVSSKGPGTQGPGVQPGGGSSRDSETVKLVRLLGRNAIWTPVRRIEMQWRTFHTQGLVKVGGIFYASAVEVTERTERNGAETDALYDQTDDRSPGAGRGWLFKFTGEGTLLGRVELTDGAKYHPGGIDYDGRSLWVPVAEYRPNSRSSIYRVDPDTLAPELVFTAPDHIGAIVRNVPSGTLHGVSWGSRRLYTWTLAGRGDDQHVASSTWVPNPQSYIDYQDCHYQGVEYMLCGGVGGYDSPLGHVAFGGLDLVDLRDARLAHQVPVNLFVDEGAGPNAGLALASNAFWVEPNGPRALRAYFMTESDQQADLLVYDVTPWINR